MYYGNVNAHFEQSARVYALHATGQHIDPRSISWQGSETNGKVIHPQIIARLPLGADTLTVMEEPVYGGHPRIDGKECNRESGSR